MVEILWKPFGNFQLGTDVLVNREMRTRMKQLCYCYESDQCEYKHFGLYEGETDDGCPLDPKHLYSLSFIGMDELLLSCFLLCLALSNDILKLRLFHGVHYRSYDV